MKKKPIPARVQPVVIPPSLVGREEQAVRWAVNHFEEWHNVTDIPPQHTGYYYEILSLIEDAAKIGFGVAHGQNFKTIMNRIKA
ncbi:MAG: hypothetical protein FJ006_12765 [Chloroflexi bacterium]|nr:hypothetical protein [Chloroflexota bacterium]